MKKKNKATTVIISAIAVLTLIGCIIIIAFSAGKTPDVPAPETGEETAGLVVDEVTDDGDVESETLPDGTEPVETVAVEVSDVDTFLTIPEDENKIPEIIDNAVATADDPADPITVAIPSDDGDGRGGVTITGDEDEQYDCGVPGHHCKGPEDHAYLVNLELEGCPYCGKHDCPSFYAVDEWGNASYNPAKCPDYDPHRDPALFCQVCGRVCGDGSGGTCVQFVNACSCPNCGESVAARTCHSCRN